MSTPIKTARVKVMKIVQDQDMRGVHKFRNKYKRLDPGSCIIGFNRAQTMARIIDWKGGVHTYYCEKGHIFDLDTLQVMVRSAFYVDLQPGATAVVQAERLWEAA